MQDLLSPGQIFAGRYRIDSFLAKGGFGAVYVAEQLETELVVALKVLWPHVLHSQAAVDQFKLEARVAGRVDSEHIVRVFDAGFDAETAMPFLVMELLRGAHLQHLVESQGPLLPATLVAYFRQIAAALDKAHRYVDRDGVTRPIVHRDLKPENLFLSNCETGGPIVKVLDFGIAKVLSGSTSVSQEVKGTPLYMAFEQAAAGKITPQTDIWALGLIAFFLLTGRNYWRSANQKEASIAQLFGEVLSLPIEPASQRARELGSAASVSPGFDAWFVRCLSREAAARFATAGECAAALMNALGGVQATAAALPTAAIAQTVRVVSPSTIPTPTVPSPGGGFGATTAQPLSLGSTGGPTVPKKSSAALVVGLVAVGLVGAAAVATRVGRRPDTSQAVDSAAGSADTASAAAQQRPVTSPSANTATANTTSGVAVPAAASGAPSKLPSAIPSVAPVGKRSEHPHAGPGGSTAGRTSATSPKATDAYEDR